MAACVKDSNGGSGYVSVCMVSSCILGGHPRFYNVWGAEEVVFQERINRLQVRFLLQPVVSPPGQLWCLKTGKKNPIGFCPGSLQTMVPHVRHVTHPLPTSRLKSYGPSGSRPPVVTLPQAVVAYRDDNKNTVYCPSKITFSA